MMNRGREGRSHAVTVDDRWLAFGVDMSTGRTGRRIVHDREASRRPLGAVAGEEAPSPALPRGDIPEGHSGDRNGLLVVVRLSGERHCRWQRKSASPPCSSIRCLCLQGARSGSPRTSCRPRSFRTIVPGTACGRTAKVKSSSSSISRRPKAAVPCVAALEGLEPELHGPEERPSTGTDDLPQDAQQSQQPLRSARRPEHVARGAAVPRKPP